MIKVQSETRLVSYDHEGQVRDIPTVYWPREDAKAVLIFVPGGTGHFNYIDKQEPQPAWLFSKLNKSTNFILDMVFMDNHQQLHPDSSNLPPNPSSQDYRDYLNLVVSVRRSQWHVDQIRATVEYYRKQTGLPVILMGHSNGTLGLSAYLDQQESIKDTVSATIFSASNCCTEITRDIAIPTLVLHHREDSCGWTLPDVANRLFQKISAVNSAITAQSWVKGGADIEGGDVGKTGKHMYYHALDEAGGYIERFLVDNLR